jgi:hypothetical protein
MTKFFPKLLFIAVLFLLFPAVSSAQVSKIAFTTDPQTIKPNELSGPITIQAQNSGGNAYQTPETIDLEFISASPTGEFLGSTGNPATKTMNKNTANRTFYYRDSAEGAFTITVNAKGRDTGQEWSANQTIVVSNSASDNNPSSSSGEVLGSSGSSSSSASSSGGSAADIVSSLNSQLEVLAGSDRTTSPGSPIWFQATVKKNTASTGLELNWSFGDGNVGIGSLVSHTYKYPGDYAVVLSARAGDIFSVSRLKVKVAESNISVSEENEYLEISNNGNTEINLFNWKLENNGKGFIFQPNTIILPHSSVKLDKSLLKMKGYDNSLGISLKNYLGEEVFSVAPVNEINLSEVSKNIQDIKEKISVMQEKAKSLGLVSETNVFSAIPANENKADSVDLPQAATGTENIIYEAPKNESFISKLTNFFKRVFSR